MATVTIRGASDDLIEVEGDIEEEFGHIFDDEPKPVYLAFSEGTVLSIIYGAGTEGFWRINRLREGTATYSKTEATDEDSDYSDTVTLIGDLKWVVFGTDFVKAKQ